ncbi:MAG: molecular chaperone HtpG [Gammaproteobacteria bacterium RIFCSPLOWO2_02_FULL_42_14]|nr:MAG: molecular chaperone HtpG [Gammaproteobacteria bacterium RIFCSPHIGHO2_02_FULL_42_43]OGT28278.1 MAG: molecular chaperone HtpG [Gammaproteobacteria bacterium RIFCSPHIGHO2_01_FULL_42_8]OGT52126.1 MAG: molecular chaperone HtpG [Gammaproteobacteria bacterium RIFCSPHIGHO2_12_FULL_41_25]OGT62563.1 MAG: molecular chaperone HtpG [Gammaproteobacteria bacterium RIFCSPLOWO2_02_FULL_42_14]OGT86546.1 MAG: molecular chaperone HtpG [Gammaproteobacteria bacterium RIFCSPLOWO2_12_FULL_42_18]
MTQESQQQTLSFGADVNQLLELVAHSLYSNPEIFLRELISNSSDAADKLRYEALSDAGLYENDSDLKIWVSFNKDNRTITLRDNGIGMNREEVIENLGTIAKSGTRAFKEKINGKTDGKADASQLIGQFGVGFYSAFVVADNVIVRTRRAGMQQDQGVYWESNGKGQFDIKNIDWKNRGTEITLFLKKDMDEFLDPYRLRTIITKYSDHIVLPILMAKIEESKKKDDKEIVVTQDEVINQAKALWTLPKNEIKDEQYQELYKHIAHDFEDALTWAHNKVEGKLEYTSLLYIPKRAPFDLWQREGVRGLKLYVKRVFIMDDAEHFMPLYLRFVKGVIDTSDLPLNVSREILQSNKTIDSIKSACVKRMLSLLEELSTNDAEKYATFWKTFGAVLKEGPAEDFANKDRIANLLRFATTQSSDDTQNVSLKDYVSRMQAGQDKIYYIVSDNYQAAKNSPLLEVFRKKNIEVLLLSDRVDEWLVAHLHEFEGKKWQSVSQGALDLGSMEDKKEVEKKEAEHKAEFKSVVEKVKKSLGDRVKEVRLTHRLTDSPACVVFDENEMTGHMQRLMKAAGQAVNPAKPILELNPEHAIVVKLKAEETDERVTRWADLLLCQALLAEGEQLENPAAFVKSLNQLVLELSQ